MNFNLPELAAGQSTTGEMGGTALAELQKALTSGYGTDVSTLTGGGSLRIQSLDKTMQATIQENKHFRLFNELAKTGAGATVDEWTEQSGVGGFLGGSTNTETGIIDESTGTYARRVGLVKYLMTKRQVSLVSTLGNKLAPKIPALFSDVILTVRQGTKWNWDTANPMADLKTRNLPVSQDIQPSFAQIVKKWQARNAAVSGTPSTPAVKS